MAPGFFLFIALSGPPTDSPLVDDSDSCSSLLLSLFLRCFGLPYLFFASRELFFVWRIIITGFVHCTLLSPPRLFFPLPVKIGLLSSFLVMSNLLPARFFFLLLARRHLARRVFVQRSGRFVSLRFFIVATLAVSPPFSPSPPPRTSVLRIVKDKSNPGRRC